MAKRQLQGKIVSNKMAQTAVVLVDSIKEHKKYKRWYKTQKKYKAHTGLEKYNIGDTVLIEECRPLSKEKKWKVIKKISSRAKEAAEDLPGDAEQIIEQI